MKVEVGGVGEFKSMGPGRVSGLKGEEFKSMGCGRVISRVIKYRHNWS